MCNLYLINNIFIYEKNNIQINLLVYVDNMIISKRTIEVIISIGFKMKDLGPLIYLFVTKVSRSLGLPKEIGFGYDIRD